jgi:hypothetical protein
MTVFICSRPPFSRSESPPAASLLLPQVGARVLLDCCQSLPHMPVDVRALGADWIVGSSHKMCGPTGIGFLWGSYELLERMPPWMGGGEMIQVRVGPRLRREMDSLSWPLGLFPPKHAWPRASLNCFRRMCSLTTQHMPILR